jgi:hypothetical protein
MPSAIRRARAAARVSLSRLVGLVLAQGSFITPDRRRGAGAQQDGLTIPPPVRARADKLIE